MVYFLLTLKPRQSQPNQPVPVAFRRFGILGQPFVPVARFGDGYAIGSAAILEELERYQPEPALLPQDDALRAEALKIQDHFDEVVGPATRCGVFAFLLDDSASFARVFGSHVGPVRRKLFQAFAMATRSVIKKS